MVRPGGVRRGMDMRVPMMLMDNDGAGGFWREGVPAGPGQIFNVLGAGKDGKVTPTGGE